MTINNAGEFYNFIRDNQLIGLSPEVSSVMLCMEEYGKMCACDPPQDKIAKQNQCRALYVTFVVKSHQYKDDLFKKNRETEIVFTVNGQQLVTLTR